MTNHMHQCAEFKALDTEQKQPTAQRLKACLNCLGSGHIAWDCLSKRSCRTCGRRHHTLLHRGESTPTTPIHPTTPINPTAAAATLLSTIETCNAASSDRTVILATCVANVEVKGKLHKARTLLDTRSTLTFVTSKLVQSLKMHKIPIATSFTGIQQTSTPSSTHRVEFNLRVPSGSVTIPVKVEAVVVDVITGNLPSKVVSTVKNSPLLKDLTLADPKFDLPGKIDLLLGADVLPEILTEGGGVRHSADKNLTAIQTAYGWTITGRTKGNDQTPCSHHCLTTRADQTIHKMLLQFWKTEDVSSTTTLQTIDEVAAVEHFKSTHTRTPEGRYVIKLPRHSNALALGCSKDQARRHYEQNERSLRKKGKWPDFMKAVCDYLEKDHAELVPETDLRRPEADCYYLQCTGC